MSGASALQDRLRVEATVAGIEKKRASARFFNFEWGILNFELIGGKPVGHVGRGGHVGRV